MIGLSRRVDPFLRLGSATPLGQRRDFLHRSWRYPSSSQAPLPGSLGKAVWAGSQIAKVARASDILLTRSVYRIGSGLACRVGPGSGDVPQPGVAPFPRFRRRVAPPYALQLAVADTLSAP